VRFFRSIGNTTPNAFADGVEENRRAWEAIGAASSSAESTSCRGADALRRPQRALRDRMEPARLRRPSERLARPKARETVRYAAKYVVARF
jgi:hypothetical protein